MRLTFGKRAGIYFLGAAAATLAVVGGHYADLLLGLVDGAELAAKLLILACMAWVVSALGNRSVLMQRGRPRRWMAVALVPFAFQLLSAFGPIDRRPSAAETLSWLTALTATVLWEEMYYRYLAVTLFVREGKISVAAVAWTATVFGASHLVNLLAHPIGVTLLQAAFAAVSGVFLLGLYLRSGHILACMAAHFFLNGTAQFFERFSSAAWKYDSPALFFIHGAVLAALGVWMLRPFCTGREKEMNSRALS